MSIRRVKNSCSPSPLCHFRVWYSPPECQCLHRTTPPIYIWDCGRAHLYWIWLHPGVKYVKEERIFPLQNHYTCCCTLSRTILGHSSPTESLFSQYQLATSSMQVVARKRWFIQTTDTSMNRLHTNTLIWQFLYHIWRDKNFFKSHAQQSLYPHMIYVCLYVFVLYRNCIYI